LKTAYIAAIVIALASVFTTAKADLAETLIQVNVGGFQGYWQLKTVPKSGEETQYYGCDEPAETPATLEVALKGWSSGSCLVSLSDNGAAFVGDINFVIFAQHSTIPLTLGGADLIRFSSAHPSNPSLTLSGNTGTGEITLNLVDVFVEKNGYIGICAFEYIVNQPTNLPVNSCEVSSVSLPLGTTWNLVIGAHQLYPVHISHLGIVYPGRSRFINRSRNSTIKLSTVDVLFTPYAEVKWQLNGAAPSLDAPDNFLNGEQTIRLVRGVQYQVAVHPDSGDAAGAMFVLQDSCFGPRQFVYVPGFGPFFIQPVCGSESDP